MTEECKSPALIGAGNGCIPTRLSGCNNERPAVPHRTRRSPEGDGGLTWQPGRERLSFFRTSTEYGIHTAQLDTDVAINAHKGNAWKSPTLQVTSITPVTLCLVRCRVHIRCESLQRELALFCRYSDIQVQGKHIVVVRACIVFLDLRLADQPRHRVPEQT